ncbi:MAG: hypothetical protein KGL38_09105 [Gemmatimonadota bacterium]|nr:hypothetical protein [Gemmatimonadota bacterium]MDE3173273.1 hypothetical protein [Gemmatimonadota bacterium]MDE3216774.1 hypothetical protein [Gemmatimonadota bacterium]
MRRFPSFAVFVAALAASAPLGAQSVGDAAGRLGPQVISYDIKAPISQKITEYVVPVYVVVPVNASFNFDVGTAWASATVASPGLPSSEMSGLTDTQLRANYTFGTDFLVLTAGVNLPTGRSTALADQQLAATRIASDFLVFPIMGFGTGAGGTGGLAIAQPLGDWNVGLGVAVRHSVAYNPFQDTSGAKLRFQPGDEYRARIGVDRPYGTGRISLGFTYSKFGNDQADQSVYNTGDRYITQASISNSIGNANVTVAGWDLFRASGFLADQTPTGRENIANAGVAVAFNTSGGVIVEPSVEGRVWTQAQADQTAPAIPASYMGTAGVRLNWDFGGYAITPFVGYTVGRMGTPLASQAGGPSNVADMSGFQATLAIRLGGGN